MVGVTITWGSVLKGAALGRLRTIDLGSMAILLPTELFENRSLEGEDKRHIFRGKKMWDFTCKLKPLKTHSEVPAGCIWDGGGDMALGRPLSHLWFWLSNIHVQIMGWVSSFCKTVVTTGAARLPRQSWVLGNPRFSAGCYCPKNNFRRAVQWDRLCVYRCVCMLTCVLVCPCMHVLFSRAACLVWERIFHRDQGLGGEPCRPPVCCCAEITSRCCIPGSVCLGLFWVVSFSYNLVYTIETSHYML